MSDDLLATDIRNRIGDAFPKAQLIQPGNALLAASRVTGSLRIADIETNFDLAFGQITSALTGYNQEHDKAIQDLPANQRAVLFHSGDQAYGFLIKYLSDLGCSNIPSLSGPFLDQNAQRRAEKGFKVRASAFAIHRSICVSDKAVPTEEDKEFTALLAHEMTHAVSHVEVFVKGGEVYIRREGLLEFQETPDGIIVFGYGLHETAGRLIGRRYLLENGYTELQRKDRLLVSRTTPESQSFKALCALCAEADLGGCFVDADHIEIPIPLRVQVLDGKNTFGGMPSEVYMSSLLRLSHRVFPDLDPQDAEKKFEELIVKSDFEGTFSVVQNLLFNTIGEPASVLVGRGVYYDVAHRIALMAYVEGILNNKDPVQLFYASANFLKAFYTDGNTTLSNEYFAGEVRYKNSCWSPPLYQSNSMGNIKAQESQLTSLFP